MSLPSSNDLLTMDYPYQGLPFVDVPTNSTVNTQTMDWVYNGLPFVTNPALNGPTNIGGWDGVTAANIQSLMGTTYTNIETIYGVT